MLCGFNKHAVKLRMHKAVPYACQYLLIHSEAIKATIKEIFMTPVWPIGGGGGGVG